MSHLVALSVLNRSPSKRLSKDPVIHQHRPKNMANDFVFLLRIMYAHGYIGR